MTFKQTYETITSSEIFKFSMNELGKIKMNEDELIKTKEFPTLEPVNPDFKIDLDEAESTAKIKALDNGISAKFSKIISALQKYEGKQVWNLTCMLEGLIILHIIIDANTGEVIKFERKSMMDLIRKR